MQKHVVQGTVSNSTVRATLAASAASVGATAVEDAAIRTAPLHLDFDSTNRWPIEAVAPARAFAGAIS